MRVLKVRGCDVTFPYKPYPSQLAMMDKTIQALKNSQNVLLELPTGSGKSMALLCAAAAWHASAVRELQEEAALQKRGDSCALADGTLPPKPKAKRQPKVFIASRTHSQLAQLVRELRKSGYTNLHMQVLGSRDQYCINSSVLKSDLPKAQACKDLLKKNACKFAYGAQRLEKHERLQQGGDLRIHDIEDLVSLGKRVAGCPYFASGSLAKEASFVFCPYSYLVDPMTRDALGLDLKGAVIIADEAHNIEDVSREAAGLELRFDDLAEICLELEQMLLMDEEGEGDKGDAQHYSALESVVRGLKEHMQNWVPLLQSAENSSVAHHITSGAEAAAVLREVGVTEDTLKPLKKFLETAMAKMEEQQQKQITEGGQVGRVSGAGDKGMRDGGMEVRTPTAKALLLVKDILTKADLIFKNMEDYRMALQQRTVRERGARGGLGGRGVAGRAKLELTLNMWCLNPAVAFADLSEKARAIILTSGTLSPMTSFSSELQTPFHAALQTPHVIDTAAQVFVGSVSVGPAPSAVRLNATYKNQDSIAFQDSLGKTILGFCRTIPHGVLCFFPSYTLMEKVLSRWEASGLLAQLEKEKLVVAEPRGGGADALEKVMTSFYDAVNRSRRKSGELPEDPGKSSGKSKTAGCGPGRSSKKAGVTERGMSHREGFQMLFGQQVQKIAASGVRTAGVGGCGKRAEIADRSSTDGTVGAWDGDSHCVDAEECGKGGALFLAVCRGKVSEGLDFADDNARGVLVVGVPYPNAMDNQVKLKKAYNSQNAAARGLLNGEEWYTLQAFRAINQAVGRCIRHIHDYGAVVLIDDRFQQQHSLKQNLSKWLRDCLIEYPSYESCHDSLSAFFQRHTREQGAYGAPEPLGGGEEGFCDQEKTTAAAQAQQPAGMRVEKAVASLLAALDGDEMNGKTEKAVMTDKTDAGRQAETVLSGDGEMIGGRSFRTSSFAGAERDECGEEGVEGVVPGHQPKSLRLTATMEDLMALSKEDLARQLLEAVAQIAKLEAAAVVNAEARQWRAGFEGQAQQGEFTKDYQAPDAAASKRTCDDDHKENMPPLPSAPSARKVGTESNPMCIDDDSEYSGDVSNVGSRLGGTGAGGSIHVRRAGAPELGVVSAKKRGLSRHHSATLGGDSGGGERVDEDSDDDFRSEKPRRLKAACSWDGGKGVGKQRGNKSARK